MTFSDALDFYHQQYYLTPPDVPKKSDPSGIKIVGREFRGFHQTSKSNHLIKFSYFTPRISLKSLAIVKDDSPITSYYLGKTSTTSTVQSKLYYGCEFFPDAFPLKKTKQHHPIRVLVSSVFPPVTTTPPFQPGSSRHDPLMPQTSGQDQTRIYTLEKTHMESPNKRVVHRCVSWLNPLGILIPAYIQAQLLGWGSGSFGNHGTHQTQLQHAQHRQPQNHENSRGLTAWD